ncbi:hypothetical protein [Haliangium ochraceum]|uniref:Uncharacterized protein n=1 Tax=Haliangium ochraceum (strain DSM 14365 / JCM 11303 / SMP-2) TaxID=502025 RepID=D0LST2_HALO1|nr:hypothetical protein [Haliangium ochraceum]ACY17304.1 hypothetical protein Hoch_4814 [Haliangium ochraceum DSM 14365]
MARRTAADFLSSFVLPLVRGGEMHVGAPISVEEAEQMALDLPHASEPLVAVDEARAEVLGDLVVQPPSLVLDADEVYLAAALHDILFLPHPDAEVLLATSRVRRRVAETARHLAAQPPTRARRRVLARHALLHNLFAIERVDTRVSWWTGSASFLGQSPPARLTAWGGVRRVQREETRARFAELLCSDEAVPVVSMLLRRSPLTQLLAAHPQAPGLHWEDAVFLLRDAEMARAVAYRALEPPEPAAKMLAPARFAAAFEQMLERSAPPEDLRAVAAFLVHLNVLLAHAELRQEPSSRSALLTTVLAPERAGKRPRGLSTFLALPVALAAVDPRLGSPPGLGQDERLAARWRVHREQVAAGVGEAVITTLTHRLRKRLGGANLLAGFGDDELDDELVVDSGDSGDGGGEDSGDDGDGGVAVAGNAG